MSRSALAWEPPVPPSAGGPAGLPPFASEPVAGESPARLLRELPLLVVTAAVIAFLLKAVVAQAFYIPSASMGCAACPVHTLHLNDRVVVSKLAYRLHEPRRGDVVVFEAPPALRRPTGPSGNIVIRVVRALGEGVGLVQPSTEDFIKRIIGIPGDTIEGRGGEVYVNGRLLVEPYLPPGVATSDFSPRTLGPDQYFVMGDNRANSNDSRSFGAIEGDLIVGRAILRVWPVPRIAYL